MRVWVNEKKWSESWEKIESLGSGGQGDVLKVRRIADGYIACLKSLSKQKDAERRARFFREATAYQTCRHELVPRLIESNADHEDDLDYKLYLVTEFVNGPTLAQFIEKNGALSFTDAVKLTKRLLDALSYLHNEQWVHRDIKPDNIIVRNDDLDWPILLDFGLCYREGISASFETELGQEVGNRFLRLPELGIGSGNKQDLRSDLAFVGGILFFVITTELPAMLQDSEGLMPHQRKSQSRKVWDAAGTGTMALLDWFDRAFHLNPQRRFTSATEMREKLDQIVALRADSSARAEGDLDFVLGYINRQTTKERGEKAAVCTAAMEFIGAVQSKLATQLQPTFVTVQAGYQQTPQGIKNTLGFAEAVNSEQRFLAEFHIEIVGGELVIRVNKNPVYRTDATSPEYGENFSRSVEGIFLKGLRDLVEDPLSHIANRGYFKSRPLMTLVDVKAKSLHSGKPMFIIIFDETHPTMGKLDYTLSYFMEYQTTKDIVDQNFEVSLVPALIGREAGLVPPDDPLEKPRWIVLAPDASVLVSEGLYANPDEGLSRVKEVLTRWEHRKMLPKV